MPTSLTPSFAGGVAAVEAYGQKTKVKFVGTWAAGESWTLPIVSTLSSNFTLGKGNIAGQSYACALKLRNRIYLGFSSSFALSANSDPTLWEEQDAGAAVVSFLSQFGAQDTVKAFASLQGRLVVLGKISSQIWSIDADPALLQLQQTLDNTGTEAPLTVKSIGDLDALYLAPSGIRSLRAKESTLNAYVVDIGTPIDLLIRSALVGYSASAACAVVEPSTMQYWVFVNGSIYVLSNYPQSKIVAWSVYKPTVEVAVTPVAAVYTTVVGGVYYWTKHASGTSLTCGTDVLTASGGFVATATSATEVGTAGTVVRVDSAVTPVKFVVYNNQVYFRASNGKIYRYGGSDNNTFDHCRATVELPWLDFAEPGKKKQAIGVEAAIKGRWTISGSLNPRTSAYTTVVDRGSSTTPSMVADSTFELGNFTLSGEGTHVKLKAVSGIAATEAKLGKLVFTYL
jgi:hypothetical protein